MPQQHNSNNMKDGIDIREALEILSLRKPNHHASNLPHALAKNWGQRIDMATTTNRTGNDDDDATSGGGGGAADPQQQQQEIEKEQADIAQQRIARRKEWKSRMDVLSTPELIRCVIQTQEERVAAYRAYDRGLEDVLQTGNFLQYPQICAEATALFSVLSDSINAIRTSLQEEEKQNNSQESAEKKELCVLITQLQTAEREKLRLTAALHLERLRATDTTTCTENDDDVSNSPRTTIAELHQRDIRSLQQSIAASVAEINECLEELKCATMLDEEETE